MSDTNDWWEKHRYGVEFRLGSMPFRTGYIQREEGAKALAEVVRRELPAARDIQVVDQVAYLEGDGND